MRFALAPYVSEQLHLARVAKDHIIIPGSEHVKSAQPHCVSQLRKRGIFFNAHNAAAHNAAAPGLFGVENLQNPCSEGRHPRDLDHRLVSSFVEFIEANSGESTAASIKTAASAQALARRLMASVYPSRILAFTLIPGHLGNVG
jgi:hypothetical protein